MNYYYYFLTQVVQLSIQICCTGNETILNYYRFKQYETFVLNCRG